MHTHNREATKGEKNTLRMLEGLQSITQRRSPAFFRPSQEDLASYGVSAADIDRYTGKSRPRNQDECGCVDPRPKFVVLCNAQHYAELTEMSLPPQTAVYVTTQNLETPTL